MPEQGLPMLGKSSAGSVDMDLGATLSIASSSFLPLAANAG
jgi:hypothetical protein